MEKTEQDFQSSIIMIRHLLELYNSGTKEAYRTISVELRKLLCDKNALLPRARPDFKLHKLHWTEVLEKTPSLREGLVMIMPGRLKIEENGNSTFQLTFTQSKSLITVKEWISQPILNVNITVWELIKSVADKEGAHSDPDYDSTLLFSKLVHYVKDESHIPTIVAIADYLIKWFDDSNLLEI
jgi:hypothetical protein